MHQVIIGGTLEKDIFELVYAFTKTTFTLRDQGAAVNLNILYSYS